MQQGTQPPAPSATTVQQGDAVPGSELDLTGRTLGDYRVLRRLGQGGMGQVYLAEQLSLKRPVALKIMRTDLAANPTALKRFQAEAEAVARVTHANIVQVYAIGVVDGLHFMALEFVDGRNLREYLAKKGPPELPLALGILRQVAAALQRAGELGIVHRDIKPENILLTRQGEAKVADFGLSRIFAPDRQPLNLTQSGVSLGTPLYMSPEQVQGQEVDPRSDIYSLGVTAYHVLAGQPPFRGQNAFEVALQHVQKEPDFLAAVRPDLPAELCAVVHKMMAKKPDERYQTSRELLQDLERLADSLSAVRGQPMPALALSQPIPTAPVARSSSGAGAAVAPQRSGRKLALAFLFGLLLVLAVGVGFVWRLSQPASPFQATPTDGPPDPEPVPFAGLNLREAALLDTVKRPIVSKDYRTWKRHLDATIELGLLYLDQRRLGEAEVFFKEWREKPPLNLKVYNALGRLGLATVWAFQDKTTEAIDLFLELEKAKPGYYDKWEKFKPVEARPPIPMMPNAIHDYPEFYLLNLPQVRRIVSEALTHNAANLRPKMLPEPLERLRKTPASAWRPPVGIPPPPGN